MEPLDAANVATFGIQASSNAWAKFFADELERPYQSYWGMLRVLGHDDGIEVLGDQQAFGQHARIWRIVLDRARDTLKGKPVTTLQEPPDDEFMGPDFGLFGGGMDRRAGGSYEADRHHTREVGEFLQIQDQMIAETRGFASEVAVADSGAVGARC